MVITAALMENCSEQVPERTSEGFIQLSFAEPELGPVDGAGVELQPEDGVSVGALGMPVVAFHLQRAPENWRDQMSQSLASFS